MNREAIINSFVDTVESVRYHDFIGVYHWELGIDEKHNKWAIVLGWADGYESDEYDGYVDGTYRVCVKLAYQPDNSVMQADYDWDWHMPYDEESGDVDDTEIAIYPETDVKKAINYLLDCYTEYME